MKHHTRRVYDKKYHTHRCTGVVGTRKTNDRRRVLVGARGVPEGVNTDSTKNTHLRRVLSRGPLVLFQAQSSPRPGRRPSATTTSSSAGDVHGCCPERLIRPLRVPRPFMSTS